jgi:hypothetical protein
MIRRTATELDAGSRRRPRAARRALVSSPNGRDGVSVETSTVATWSEHQRRHERSTQGDVPLEQGEMTLARARCGIR